MRVLELASGEKHESLLKSLMKDLPDDSHIEHILSFLADHIAIAERSVTSKSNIGGDETDRDQLLAAHEDILKWIADTIRWGYESGSTVKVGSRDNPLIRIDEHLSFVRALFDTTHAGVAERRLPVKIFTTNYDTLLEDALALCGVPYWDGFDGGAVAFRSHRFGAQEPTSGFRAHVVKLHGSIDWHVDDESRIWRVRDGDTYPAVDRRVVIYPQATKYIATQKDPFASQFDIFRRQLCLGGGHVLVTCGYSFGDEHINEEIGSAMSRGDNDAVLLALISEADGMPKCLDEWRNSSWGEHVYILTDKGVYVGAAGPFLVPRSAGHKWWTFEALAQLLTGGVGGQIL
tara:strand:- start:1976 stop:3013 length:1038 start_codon:yes stop_codon:yes gene_type:complete